MIACYFPEGDSRVNVFYISERCPRWTAVGSEDQRQLSVWIHRRPGMMMAEGDEFFTALSSAGWEVALPGNLTVDDGIWQDDD